MVAVVSGSSLGLLNTSFTTLGSPGTLGDAAVGRAREGAFVNAATGNLVLQSTDEYLASHGLDVPIARTYNSQGLLDDDNGDGWQLGLYKKVSALTGRVNRAGSTVTRTEGDGSASVYAYDATLRLYRSTDGAGAYDTLEHRGNSWTWTDGTTGVTETYDDSSGLITQQVDLDGNTTSYRYNSRGLMTVVADESGDRLLLDYSGNNLSRVRVMYNDGSGPHTLLRTQYSYDALNRLTQVLTDLSPQDSSVSDGNTYWTRYTYEGTSRRVGTLTQKDGTALAFAYVQSGGNYRVRSITDGEGRITLYDYDTAARSTTVTDPLGNVTKLAYDTDGQLLQVTAPAVGGTAQVTRFAYNAKGDVATITDARGLAVNMAYDANGNQVERRDAAGNTVRRIFSATNKLLVEIAYTAADPDDAGAAQPAGPLSTRYVYDSNDHLRFLVSPEGRVTEYRYNGRGERVTAIQYTGKLYGVGTLAPTATLSESSLSGWVLGADRTAAQRVDYAYDALGQLRTATSWATLRADGTGNRDGRQSVVTYTYGASGELLQAIDGNGKQASYAYDGFNRLIASTDANGVTTTTVYDDAANRTTVKLANGLWTTSAYNKAGELVSVTQSNAGAPLGTSSYVHDAASRLLMETDPTGQRVFHLYDAAGRKSADIDAAGSLVEYRYNADNQLTRRIRYENAVDLALLVDAGGQPIGADIAAIRPPASLSDRSTWTVYDAAGRLVQSIDGEGYVSETTYDGAGRVLKVTEYATATIVLAVGDVPDPVVVASSADDRVTRNFYDKDGKLLGQLDAEGYLTTFSYDAAGQRVGSYAFAQATRADLRATGTLDQLTPAKQPAQDIAGTSFYDRKGRLVGIVDGEGYLTEQIYDLGGNLVRKLRYTTKVTAAATLDATRPATPGETQTWTYTYTALNRLATETAPDGTVTRHTYDNAGNRTETTRGWQSEDPRTATRRYDVQGRLVAELGGEGSARLALAGTPAAIESVWATYAQHYAYDAAGRRVSSTDANGHRTLYYYDGHGQLAATINAEGEVLASAYDALGDLKQSILYASRVSAADLARLAGGAADDIAALLSALRDPTHDAVTSYSYDHDGRKTHETDALGFGTDYVWRAFGIEQTREQIDGSRSLVRSYRYDHRGLQLETTADRDGVAVTETSAYDAFGRLIQSADANGAITTRSYDRLGRQVTLQAPIGLSTTTYDAFDRVTLQVDATGRQTRTAYDTANRKFTVTLPDGSSFVTVNNRHGDKVSFTDASGNTTSFAYDKDGHLKDVSDAQGRLEHHDWDFANNELARIDANGTVTTYGYDGANRVLTQTVDATGLNLVTLYSYDTAGRVLTVTDPRGSVTRTDYDAKGQARRVTVDDGGLNLVTHLDYDGRGRTLSVTDPADRVTTYGYDSLGQRTSETTGGLTTRYFYDKAGNVTARQDAAGNVTRYAYDANQRKVYEIDGAGGVQFTAYDDAGRITSQRQHTVAINAGWFAGLALDRVLQPSEVAAQLQPSSVDAVQERILDASGRLAFTVDAAGGLTQYQYDGNGNLVQRRAFANALGAGVPHTYAAIAAQLPAPDARDHVIINRYDSRNRLTRQFEPQATDGSGALTIFGYDASGNLTDRITYSMRASSIDQTPASTSSDRRERTVYDRAGRAIAKVVAQKDDGQGHTLFSLERFDYDGAGNVKVHRQSANFLSSATYGGDTIAWLTTLGNDDAHDRVERFDYDGAGRLVRKTGAEGAVCDYRYDGAGNLIAQTEYASTSANPADAANRITRTVYDTAGRSQYTIDAEGAVTQLIRDGAGRVSKTIRYAGQVNLAALQLDAAAVAAALRPNSAQDRVEQSVFDAAGRLVYSIDAEGAVKKTDYDAAGHIEAVTRFAVKLPTWNASASPDVWSAAGLQAALTPLIQGNAQPARTDTFNYDATGLLLSSSDALGFTEAYTYDAVGNKLSFTNKSGFTWNYDYDGAGRLLKETTPLVQVTTLQYAPNIEGPLPAGASRMNYRGAWVVVTPATTSVRLDTVMAYDALGNLSSRTEAAGSPTERTTRYEYDAVGRQVRTLYPQVGVDDGTAPSISDFARHEATAQLSSTVVYDALGNAISGRDVAGQENLKAYDRAGRLSTETDALGGVTEYHRNAFGEVDRLTRKARLAGEADRSISTTYDRAGRAVQVRQPLAFSHDNRAPGDDNYAQTTWTDYDAFGQATRVTVGGSEAGGALHFTTGITRYYYDRRGGRVGELSELVGANGTSTGGYLTATRFDADGNAVETTEYATLVGGTDDTFDDYANVVSRIASDPTDRATRTEYDALNRKVAEIHVGRYTSESAAQESLRTEFLYDAVGNLTGTRDAAGALTITRYDSLGRKVAVIAPGRVDADGAGAVTPLTEFRLDAYGNVLARTDYAGGATSVNLAQLRPAVIGAENYQSATYVAPTFDAARDRRTYFAFDALGRNTAESDALGSVTEHSYDAAGRLARTWTRVVTPDPNPIQTAFTFNRYDAVGRLVDIVTPGSQSTAPVTTHVDYNTFGEVVRKTVDGLQVERNDYDEAGRVWRTMGSDGVARVFVRDVDGRVTREITNPDLDLMSAQRASDAQVTTGNRITETVYDSLGHAVSTVQAGWALPPVSSNEQIAFVEAKVLGHGQGEPIGDPMTGHLWNGTNELQLSWPSLLALGSTDVKVTVEYLSPDKVAGVEIPRDAGRYEHIFEGWQADTGAKLTWASSDLHQTALDTITRIQVAKKNLEGEWVTLIDRPGSSAWGVWVTAEAPQDLNQTAEMWTRAHGSSEGFSNAGAMVRFGDKLLFTQPAGATAIDYDYEVRSGGAIMDSGEFKVISLVGEIPVASRPQLSQEADGVYVKWPKQPAGTLQQLRFRREGSTEWANVVDETTGDTNWLLDLGAENGVRLGTDLGYGQYEYELLFYRGTTADTLQSHAYGTLSLLPKVVAGTATDPQNVPHTNVLMWPAADRPGSFETIEVRTADYSSDPPLTGEWESRTAQITSFGALHGIALDDQDGGVLQYRVQFHEGSLMYAQSSGAVFLMPTPAVDAAGPQTLSWTQPREVFVAGKKFTVAQVLTITDLATGASTDGTQFIHDLGNGRSGISFDSLINGYAHAFDYKLEWAIPDFLGKILTLGASSGRVHYGPAQPEVFQPGDTTGARLRWPIPTDLTGAPMQMTVLARLKGGGTWFPKTPLVDAQGLATLDFGNVEPGEYEYRIEYRGRETANADPVFWAANEGTVTTVPQPQLAWNAGTDPVTRHMRQEVLSWPARLGEYPLLTPTLTLQRRGGGSVMTPEVQAPQEGREWVNLQSLPAGQYDYVLVYRRPDGSEFGRATGTVSLAPEPALQGSSGTVLTWDAPDAVWPGLNVRQVFEARMLDSGQPWTDFTHLFQPDGTGKVQGDLGGLAPSAWEYRVRFIADAGNGPTLGEASGTLLSIPRPHIGAVDGFELPPAALSWMAPPAGFHTVVRLALDGSATPDYDALAGYAGPLLDFISADASARRQGLDLEGRPPGQYAYEVEYVQDASGITYGKVKGRFTHASAATLANVPAHSLLNLEKDSPVLYWTRATDAQPWQAQLTLTGPQGTIGPLAPAIRSSDWEGVDLSALATGAYSYVVRFTNGSGTELTSSGTFFHAAPASLQGNYLTWDAPPAGSTVVLHFRNFGAGPGYPGRRTAIDFEALPGGKQGYDLSALGGSADIEYQVEYVGGDLSFASTSGDVRLVPTLHMGEDGPSVLSWDPPPDGITQLLSFRPAGSDGPFAPAEFGTRAYGGRVGIDLKSTRAGDYEVRLLLTRGAEVWGSSTAVVRVVSQASFGANGTAASVLTWPPSEPGISTSLQVWHEGVPINVNLPAGATSVDFSDRAAYPFGGYTYRLTFIKDGQTFGTSEGSFDISVPPTIGFDTSDQQVSTPGTHLAWSQPPQGASQTLQWANLTTGVGGTLARDSFVPLPGGLLGLDITVFPAGKYTFTLTTQFADGTSSTDTGSVTLLGDPSVGALDGVLTWRAGANGETAKLYYGATVYEPQPSNGTYSVDFSWVGKGDYPFTVAYFDANGQKYGEVTSTFRVQDVGAVVGTASNPALFASPLTITKASDGAGNTTTFITFTDTGEGMSFGYGDAGGWHYLPVSRANGQCYVEVSQVPNGSYSYELSAVNAAGYYSHTTGTFSLNHAGETLTSPMTTLTGVYVTGDGQLRWPVPTTPFQSVQFTWKPHGSSVWNYNVTPQRIGNEFVVNGAGMDSTSYDVAIVFTGISPVSGDTVWISGVQGLFTKTYEYIPGSPQYDYPDLTAMVMEGTAPDGHRIINLGFYNSFAYTNAELYIGVPKVYSYSLGGGGTVYWELQAGVYYGAPYRIELYNSGQLVAYTEGTYSDYGYLGGASVNDYWHSWAPATAGSSYTSYSYSFYASLPGYQYVASGSPILPTLGDNTPLPQPPHHEFGVFGNQDRYYYGGAASRWRLLSSTASGGTATNTGSRVAHQDYGNAGSIANAAGANQEISSAGYIALLDQNVSDSLSNGAVSTHVNTGSQHQEIGYTYTSKGDGVIDQTAPISLVDGTRPGTAPVSLPFNQSYLRSDIQSHPQAQNVSEARVDTTYDRWGEALTVTDARSAAWKTTYTYNAAGQTLTQAKPSEGAGASVTHATYDVSGHLISTRDANDNLTSFQYDSAGNLVREKHADLGLTWNRYDAFGNKTQTWTQAGSDAYVARYAVTNYGYDLKGQLTEVSRPSFELVLNADGSRTTADGSQVHNWLSAGFNGNTQDVIGEAPVADANIVERYAYDSLGRRVSTTLALSDGQKIDHGVTQRVATTRYDLLGNVIAQAGYDGIATAYSFDALGRKTRETRADGTNMTWSYNGGTTEVDLHFGLDGVAVKSIYNHAGELVQENTLGNRTTDSNGGSAGMNRVYAYDARGQLTRIVDTSQAGVTQTTTYRYDAAGNRTLERTESTSDGGTLTLQDSHSVFDAQGRLATVEDGRMKVDYGYDAAGNKRREHSAWVNDSGTIRESDLLMTYDAMNRVLTQRDSASTDAAQFQGKQFTYDLQGRQTSQTYYGSVLSTVWEDNLQRDKWQVTGKGTTRESYAYDAAGRLTEITRDGRLVEKRFYDAQGRLLARDGAVVPHLPEDLAPQDYSALGLDPTEQHNVYEGGSERVRDQYVKSQRQLTSGGEPTYGFGTSAHSNFHYNAVGNLDRATTETFGAGYVSTDTTEYELRALGDRYAEFKQSRGGAQVLRTYDGNGFLSGVLQQYHGASPSRKIYSDAQGHILRNQALDGSGNPGVKENFLIAQGQQLTKSADDDIEDTYTDAAGLNTQFDTVQSAKATSNSAGSYVVQKGDTLQSIAKAAYGDSSYWYAIAEANGLGNGELQPGRALIIPSAQSIGAGSTNSATSIRPYDPTQALGEVTPNLPAPKFDDGCGGFAQVIVMAVAIAVAAVTQQWYLTQLGSTTGATIAAGALAGATGSVASQAVGNVIGLQQGFDWKGVALAAVGGGVGAGLEGSTPLGSTAPPIINAAVRSAVGSIITQGIGVATGLQEHFSWQSVAAAAVGSGVGAVLSRDFGGLLPKDSFSARFATSLVAGAAAAVAHGGRVTVQQVAVDAFGNALGSSIVDVTIGSETPPQRPSPGKLGSGTFAVPGIDDVSTGTFFGDGKPMGPFKSARDILRMADNTQVVSDQTVDADAELLLGAMRSGDLLAGKGLGFRPPQTGAGAGRGFINPAGPIGEAGQAFLDNVNEVIRETRGLGPTRGAMYRDFAASGKFADLDRASQRGVLAAMVGYSDSINQNLVAGGNANELAADAAVRYATDAAVQSGAMPEWRFGAHARAGALSGIGVLNGPVRRQYELPTKPELVDVGPQGQYGARFYVRPNGETLDAKAFDRAKFRSGMRDQVWDEAVDQITGRVTDPLSGVTMSKQQPWEMGHRPQMEYWKERQDAIGQWLYENKLISRDEFINRMNDPARYRPELPESNRSHKGEDRSTLFRR